VAEAMGRTGPFYLPHSRVEFSSIESAFAIALHMHQPLIPADGDNVRTAGIIGNLEHMMNSPDDGDNHNATVFARCYERMGEFIPQLVKKGKQPRVMLDYSGCLLHGLCTAGLKGREDERRRTMDDGNASLILRPSSSVLSSLREVTCDREYRSNIEWLGTPWGHPVASSTPVQDYRLHVRAGQHFFASLFGFEALSRVRGFSPSEMALPNHPDVCYEFVKTLRDCGYRWVLVQEHTVERAEPCPEQSRGSAGVFDPYVPHRLVARNSRGQTCSITAIIKTQGSDTKLVGQMQPYYEAMTLGRRNLPVKSIPSGVALSVPPVVTQIADGENGGVMMNEFPPKYLEVMAEASGSKHPAVNVTEYLEHLDSLGITEEDFPAVQPIMQGRIWQRFPDGAGPKAMEELIQDLTKEDDRFHMEGGSWTNDRSWVRGYENVLGPMQTASAMFAEKIIAQNVPTSHPKYREALFHLMIAQTSCFRYWGEGTWTDYGRELCRRTIEILQREF